VNQGLNLVLRLDNLVITGACLSSRYETVVLKASKRETDFGGLFVGWL